MREFSFTEARQNFASILNEAKNQANRPPDQKPLHSVRRVNLPVNNLSQARKEKSMQSRVFEAQKPLKESYVKEPDLATFTH